MKFLFRPLDSGRDIHREGIENSILSKELCWAIL
jgi:hypothetical protein